MAAAASVTIPTVCLHAGSTCLIWSYSQSAARCADFAAQEVFTVPESSVGDGPQAMKLTKE
eukprot:3242973-Prorocentrum_lima.AAC.1